MFAAQEDGALAVLIGVGVVEQAQAALEPEDAPDGLVDPGQRDLAVADQ